MLHSLFEKITVAKVRKARGDWDIDPGTVLRCDLDTLGSSRGSAVFVCVPYVFVDSFSGPVEENEKSGGKCLPQRLHQYFNPFQASAQDDRRQQFRQYEGQKTKQILWVHQLWMLASATGRLRLALPDSILSGSNNF